MSHVVLSKKGMSVHRLVCLLESEDGLVVEVRWSGSPDSEDTFEPFAEVSEDVSGLLRKLLLRKNTPSDLVAKVCRALLTLRRVV